MKLFVFTIIDHDFYKNLADYFQKTTIRNTTSRGTIMSSEESLRGVVAASTNLGTLAIDPSQKANKAKLLSVLSDAVMTEFCGHITRALCLENIGNYTRDDTLKDQKNLTEEDIKKRIADYLEKRMDAPVESMLIEADVNDDAVTKINAIDDEALFFVSNNLYVNPTKVKNGQALAAKLSSILGKDQEFFLKKFEIIPKQHLEIIRRMSLETRDYIVDVLAKNREVTAEATAEKQKEEASAQKDGRLTDQQKANIRTAVIEEMAFYPYVKIEDNFVRYYPEWASMGQITGYMNNEGVGQYGIEWYFENELQGEVPIQVITKDNKGRPLKDYTSSGALLLKNGADLTLTIDRNIQKEVSQILEKSVKKFRANRWSVIITNPKTGAIIAMVNYPNYDPNNYTDVYEIEPVLYSQYPNPGFDLFGIPLFVIDETNGTISHNIDGKLVKLRAATDDEIANSAIQKYKYKNGYWPGNYQNSTISALYEPGSVFKAITTAIGLDTGEITPNMSYYDRNSVTLSYGAGTTPTVIKNYSQSRCGGWHTYASALNWSCNVGMIDIAEKVGRSLFDSYIRNFGFGTKTDITMDGEVFSQISPYDRWSRAQFFTMSFGQGISATLIQMASAYNVLANGGIYMKPYIIESIEYPNKKKIDTVPYPMRRVISEETSKTITAMLADSAKNGYAAAGAVPGYTMAGKTGTSQIPYRGTYENLYFSQALWHTVTSYGWYAPAYNPKFVMVVMIDRPRTSSDSEKTSAPLYAEIAQYLLKYYNVPKWQN